MKMEKKKKEKQKKNQYTYVKLYIVDLSKINDLGKYNVFHRCIMNNIHVLPVDLLNFDLKEVVTEVQYITGTHCTLQHRLHLHVSNSFIYTYSQILISKLINIVNMYAIHVCTIWFDLKL